MSDAERTYNHIFSVRRLSDSDDESEAPVPVPAVHFPATSLTSVASAAESLVGNANAPREDGVSEGASERVSEEQPVDEDSSSDEYQSWHMDSVNLDEYPMPNLPIMTHDGKPVPLPEPMQFSVARAVALAPSTALVLHPSAAEGEDTDDTVEGNAIASNEVVPPPHDPEPINDPRSQGVGTMGKEKHAFFKLGGGPKSVKMPIRQLSRHMFVCGRIGHGKTTWAQHVIERIMMQVPSIKNIIIFDPKGDWASFIGEGSDNEFNQIANVHVYTFGSRMGYHATLDPYHRVQDLFGLDLDDCEDLKTFNEVATRIACDVLCEIVVPDRESHFRLEGGTQMPTKKDLTGQYGISVKSQQQEGDKLKQFVTAVYEKCVRAGDRFIPTDNDMLVHEIKQAKDPHVGGTDDDMSRVRVNFKSATIKYMPQGDIEAFVRELETKHEGILFRTLNRSTRENNNLKPMDDSVLFAKPEDGKTNVHIVSLKLCGNGETADAMRKMATSRILRNVREQAPLLGGSQEEPRVMLVTDEADELFPAFSRSKQTGRGVEAVGYMKDLMKNGRDRGIVCMLATQQPGNINKELFEHVTGGRFVGRIAEENRDVEAIRKVLLSKDSITPKQLSEYCANLKPHEFLAHVADSSLAADLKVVKAPGLKRTRGHAGPWLQPSGKGNPLEQMYKDCDVDNGSGETVKKRMRVY